MKRLIFIVVYGAVWSGLVAGSLQLGNLQLPDGHAFCGPWGCLPNSAALISVHSLWASLFIPLAVLLVWSIKSLREELIWQIVFAVVSAVMIVFVAYDGWHYVSSGGNVSDWHRRAVFSLVTATDFPVVQLALASGLNWCICKMCFAPRRRSTRLDKTKVAKTLELEV